MELNANEETTCKQRNHSFSSDKYTFQVEQYTKRYKQQKRNFFKKFLANKFFKTHNFNLF